MKNTIMMTIIAVVVFGISSTSFAENRSRFMGVTYVVPETTYQQVSDNTVRIKETVRSKFMGATYIVPERTYVSVSENVVRKSDPIRSKFMGVTYTIKD